MRKRYIFGALIVIILLFSGVQIYKYQMQYTGQEWYARQEEYIETLRTYVGEMDDIFALYLGGSIQETDFLNHISVLQNEVDIIQEVYEQEKEKHPVRLGTYTYEQKLGCEGVEDVFSSLQDVLSMARENSADRNALSYKYLALHQNLIDAISKYISAQIMIEADSVSRVNS